MKPYVSILKAQLVRNDYYVEMDKRVCVRACVCVCVLRQCLAFLPRQVR